MAVDPKKNRAPSPAPSNESRERTRFTPALKPATGDEHRGFPRASLVLRFEVWIPDGNSRRFSALLESADISVGGAFLKSTFFLPVGTELSTRFTVQQDEVVEARIEIVRHEQSDGKSGLGVRFIEFFSQSEVALARVFLDQRLQQFTAEYMASQRAKRVTTEAERLVDALAAWELLKATSAENPWKRL